MEVSPSILWSKGAQVGKKMRCLGEDLGREVVEMAVNVSQ